MTVAATTERRLRVMQVSTADLRGGAEQVAWNLFGAVRSRGHGSWLAVGEKLSNDPDVVVVPNDSAYGSWSHLWRGVAARLERTADMNSASAAVARLAGAVAAPGSFMDYYRGREDFRFPGTKRLLELAPEPLDVVHGHNLHGGYFDLRVLPSLSRQANVVLTLHDAWLLSGHCAHSFECGRWETGCGECPDLTIYPAIRRDATAHNWKRKRAIFGESRLRVATPSRWLMAKVERSMLAPGVVDARVIPNGVDLSVFRPGGKHAARAALGLPPDAPVVVAVGVQMQRNPWKDFSTLEAAVKILADQWSGPTIHVVVVGADGAPASPAGNVRTRLVPFEQDTATLASYYRAADVYIHSARADTFPLTVVEALACGTPVVASSVGGIPEQVEDGVSGFVVPPGDPVAMATAVRSLLDEEDLRTRQGDEAARLARRRFGLERQVEAYLDWYAELVDASPRTAAA
jgi:glycosyltransferase involved in cell wall biosynthesis